eukprot:4673346-Prymnesium_polylepis.1
MVQELTDRPCPLNREWFYGCSRRYNTVSTGGRDGTRGMRCADYCVVCGVNALTSVRRALNLEKAVDRCAPGERLS